MTKSPQNCLHKTVDFCVVTFLLSKLENGNINFVNNTVSNGDFEQILKEFNQLHSSEKNTFSNPSLYLQQPYVIDHSHFSALLNITIMVMNYGLFHKHVHIPGHFENEINNNLAPCSNNIAYILDDIYCYLIYHILFQLFLKEKCKINHGYCQSLSELKIYKDFYSFLDEKISFLTSQCSNCSNFSCINTKKLLINIKDNKDVHFCLQNMNISQSCHISHL